MCGWGVRNTLLTAVLVATIFPCVTAVSHAQGRGAAAPDPVDKIAQLKPDLYYVAGAAITS